MSTENNQTATIDPAVLISLKGYAERIESNIGMLPKTLISIENPKTPQERANWHSMANTIVTTMDSELHQLGSEHAWVLGDDMSKVFFNVFSIEIIGKDPKESTPTINNGKDWLAYAKGKMKKQRHVLQERRRQDGVIL